MLATLFTAVTIGIEANNELNLLVPVACAKR